MRRRRLVDPVAGRMHLDPVARFGGDERSLARVILDLEAEVGGALERLGVALLVQRDPDVVDARVLPVAGLEDDVHRPAGELHEAEPETDLVQLLPGGARLEPLGALAAPAVPAQSPKPSLPR